VLYKPSNRKTFWGKSWNIQQKPLVIADRTMAAVFSSKMPQAS